MYVNNISIPLYSDIKFLVGEERQVICAHKCLLAARCEVFRAMFAVQKTEEQQAPLVLTDIKPRIFLALMEFIYTNCCNLSTECVVDIMASSIEYGLDGLTKVMEVNFPSCEDQVTLVAPFLFM